MSQMTKNIEWSGTSQPDSVKDTPMPSLTGVTHQQGLRGRVHVVGHSGHCGHTPTGGTYPNMVLTTQLLSTLAAGLEHRRPGTRCCA